MASTGVLHPSNYPDHFQTNATRTITFTTGTDGKSLFVPLFIAPPLPTDGKVKRYRWWDQVDGFVNYLSGTDGTVTARVVELAMPLDQDLPIGVAHSTKPTRTALSSAVAVTENTLFTIVPTGTEFDGNRVTPGKVCAVELIFGTTTSALAGSITVDASFRTRAH